MLYLESSWNQADVGRSELLELFAIMNSRKRHNKLLFNSKLDGIPGVGEARKKIIINHFGGIQGVLKASIKELESITGINNKLAETIYYNIHK